MKDKQESVVEQVEENSTSNIGKFDSAEQLLKAYNALEREFTKRCQLIKELQARLDPSGAQAQEQIENSAAAEFDPVPEPPVEESVAVAEPPVEAVPPEAEQLAQESVRPDETAPVSSGNFMPSPDDVIAFAVRYTDVISDIPEIMDACIARYKRKLIGRGAGVAPAGAAVIVPAMRPRTLADAKRLADELLGN